ncbi:MAG: hypothetical protein Q9172_007454 [Xanthocarpia lactea]
MPSPTSSSSPSTPSSETPRDRAGWRFNHIYQPAEWVEAYRPTGYHPVHFGDLLHNGQYKIIRKLGYGSFSAVWLARDTRHLRYVAIKIKKAKDSIENSELSIMHHLSQQTGADSTSAHVITLLDHFYCQGPNGTHLCLVLEPMGASVADMLEELPQNKVARLRFGYVSRYPKWMAKRVLTHILRGIAFLHLRGVIHGDIQPGNLLFSASSLDSVGVEELEDDETGAVVAVERLDKKADKWAPKYMAISDPVVDYTDLDPEFTIKVSDLGAGKLNDQKNFDYPVKSVLTQTIAFISDNVSKDPITPVGLRSPELILKAPFDQSIDIWSFGCLVYELLAGTPLFAVMHMGGQDMDDCDDDHLLQMTDIMGPLPEHLFSRWSRSSKYFNDNGELFNSMIDGPPKIIRFGPLEDQFRKHKSNEIAEEEEGLVLDLLRYVLRYEPKERPSAEDVLKHAWFSSDL